MKTDWWEKLYMRHYIYFVLSGVLFVFGVLDLIFGFAFTGFTNFIIIFGALSLAGQTILLAGRA